MSKPIGIRCVSVNCNTDENYRDDETKVRFYFHDYQNEIDYKGAVTWEKLFELLKPHLTAKRSV